MIRRRRLRTQAMPEITLTPLIDTALVLLVIFMVATPIMQNSLNIDLPEGQMQEDAQQSKDPVLVTIDDKESFFLNGSQHSLDDLLKELVEKMKLAEDKKVILQCDQKVSSGTLVKTIDSIKYVAGVEHVVLSTERA